MRAKYGRAMVQVMLASNWKRAVRAIAGSPRCRRTAPRRLKRFAKFSANRRLSILPRTRQALASSRGRSVKLL